MKKFFAIFAFFCVFSQVFCEKSWKMSNDQKIQAFVDEEDFEWTGGRAKNFAHGSGTRKVYKDGKLVFFVRETREFGALSSDFVQIDGSADFFAGNFAKNKKIPDGFGVLKKQNGAVYVGDFKKGELSGKAARFDSDGNLLFYGDFKKGRYNGRGELYQNGEIVYSGEFKNGVRHGKGSEFSNGSILEGEWKNDKKVGEFFVETASDNGAICRTIVFENGEPRHFGKIHYPNGIDWNGNLGAEFEAKGEKFNLDEVIKQIQLRDETEFLEQRYPTSSTCTDLQNRIYLLSRLWANNV